MKINNQNPASIAAQTGKTDATQATDTNRRTGQTRSSSGQTTDGVQLSSLAGRISHGLEVAEGSRAEYVNRIAEALRSGTYQTDSAAISRGLIDEALSKKA